MTEILSQKKALLEKVYFSTRNNSLERSLNGISKHIDRKLLDDYKFHLSYKSFETYYKSIVENNRDCTIKLETLNKLSEYIGYKSFKDFCDKEFKDVIISEKDHPVLEEISSTLSQIKETISNGLSYLMTGKSSFGIFGIIIVAGVFLNKYVYKTETNNNEISSQKDTFKIVANSKQNEENVVYIPQTLIVNPSRESEKKQTPVITETKRKRECMYWNGECYIEVFCDERIEGREIIALNEERKLMRKITEADTLTVENALGKVWYDKSNNKVEFFTHYGTHPENGKALKDVSETIIEKYAKK